MSIQNKIDETIASLRAGAKVKIANDGNAVEEVVIRYKEFFFSIMLDADSGQPTGEFGWSRDAGMHPATPIRDFYTAVREEDTPTTESEEVS